jgi:3-oxoacid CoA-transferase subunit A/glutaconate CoA-transferase subunit A
VNILEEGLGELIQPPDMEAFREWNRNHKSRRLVDKVMSEQEAIRQFVPDGSYLGTELYGPARAPMSLIRELIRQNPKNLRLCSQGVHELDFIVAGCDIEAIDISYHGLEVYGVSAVLRRAVETGKIKRITDWSNSAITWRMKAAAMGVPFLPGYAMLGTDTFRHSAAKLVEDPFTGGKIALYPALILDVVLIHAHRADRFGNVQVDGVSGLTSIMAAASKRVIVSVEEIIDTEQIRRQPDRTTIPYYLVDAVVHAPFGSHPGENVYVYARDEDEICAWVKASKTAEGVTEYLNKYIYSAPDQAAYLALFGEDRLAELRRKAESHR